MRVPEQTEYKIVVQRLETEASQLLDQFTSVRHRLLLVTSHIQEIPQDLFI